MSGVYSFKKQLRAGQIGEIIFEKAHQNDLVRLDGFKSDFQNKATGAHLELKSDFYTIEGTPNFFIERYSNKQKKSPGGPWQSLANGVTHFVYFFVPSLTYFTFDTVKLVKHLEKIEKTLSPVDIKNESHTTMGYRVPRESLSKLYEQTTLTVTVTNG